jgi:hypothetical protein
MITSTIRTFDHFPQLTAEIEARTVRALDHAASAGAAVANAAGERISTFIVVPAHPTGQGFASGIRARNPLWRIFDKGSLGKRHARLKKDRRMDEWMVNRGGSPYTASRGDTTGKGVEPRNISTPARTAGRRALLDGILRHF